MNYVSNPDYNYKCPVCHNYSFYCSRYEVGYDIGLREIGTEPPMFFSREYHCSLCQTRMSLYTIVDTLNINELLGRDAKWLEKLK